MSYRDFHESPDSRALVKELCDRVAHDLGPVVANAVKRIRQELPVYRAIPLGDHRDAVHEQLRRRVLAVGEERPPSTSDLQTAGALARARAAQHIAISTLIDAYHIGDSELWHALVMMADDRTAPVLPRLAGRMMDSLHTLSSELASAHSDVAQSLQGHRITLVHRFIELLSSGPVDREVEAVAQALGLDPDQTWQAVLWSPLDPASGIPFSLQHRLAELGSTIVCVSRGDTMVAMAGTADHAAVRSFAARHLGSGRLGVGLPRPGLKGAAWSLEDARMALDTAVAEGEVREFAESWIEACVLSQAERLRPLLQKAIDVAIAHPHLAEAVEAHWHGSLSLATTSKRMNLHANSLTYRLSRWRDLTGLNPRTVSGGFQSWVAVLEARRGARSG